MQVTPLSHALGAEVTGLDLRAPPAAAEVAALRAALLEHLLVVVRGQALDTAAQLRLAACLGEIEEVRTKKDDPARRQLVLFVSNRPVEGSSGVLPEGPLLFHSDQCYYERPCRFTLLNAMVLPGRGGETRFANMYRAWETLPGALRGKLRGRLALNLFDYEADRTTRHRPVNPDAPQFVHPVVIRHPETGRAALYVNPQMTRRIVDMDAGQSERLLERVFAHLERPELVYEHVWRSHDLLIWDNRCTIHGRRDFDAAEARILRRVAVRGERPAAA